MVCRNLTFCILVFASISIGFEVFNIFLILLSVLKSYGSMKNGGYDTNALDGVGVMVKLGFGQLVHAIKLGFVREIKTD